jgi:hypothetical protein
MSTPLTGRLHWDNAPSWANYLAMDGNGNWCWYESRPKWIDYDQEWYALHGLSVLACKSPYVRPDATLQQRPQKDPQQ